MAKKRHCHIINLDSGEKHFFFNHLPPVENLITQAFIENKTTAFMYNMKARKDMRKKLINGRSTIFLETSKGILCVRKDQ